MVHLTRLMALSDYLFQKLCSYLGHSPTDCQRKLFACFAGYLMQEDGKALFVVNGYAGTGKTSSVLSIVRLMEEAGQKVALMAPTGRAAKVLSSYAQKTALTIHKTIYREKQRGAAASQFVLHTQAPQDTLFIVDEASLISNQSFESSMFGSGALLDDLVEYVWQGRGNRLMLIGDAAQLPPVGLVLSPALDTGALSRYGRVYYVEMTQVVRQAVGSGILHVATILRRQIQERREGLPGFELRGFPDVKKIHGGELMEYLQEAYDRYGREDTIVLCRSNKRANRYNEGIRGSILFCDEALQRGDRVMVVKNCYQFIDSAVAAELPFIANGDVAEVLRVGRHEERYGCHFAQATLRFSDYKDIELDTKVLLDTLSLETPSLGTERQQTLFAEVLLDYAHISGRAKMYAAAREDVYYNALQLKYAAAITTHKAQGGQWKAVFIDYAFFKDHVHNVEDLRWFYTAVSRATGCLYLVNFP